MDHLEVAISIAYDTRMEMKRQRGQAALLPILRFLLPTLRLWLQILRL